MTALRTESLPRFDTLLLAILASGTLAVVRVDSAWHPAAAAARIACEWAVALGLWGLVRRYSALREHGQRYLAVSLLVALLFPYAFEYGQRWLGGTGAPLEITMLISFQLATLVLAVFSFLPRLGGSSVLFSGFLLLFSSAMTTNPVAFLIGGTFGVLGLWWLMGAYWDRIEGAFVASSVERQIPVRASVIGGTGLLLLLLGSIVGATGTSAVVLRGFMPTSGGNHWHDPHARSGVGDGDAMVAAQDQALSFGPVESELFLDSDMPSLYDMFDENYGEPPRPNRKQQRAIALAPQEREETEQRIAKTERSGREFSTVRRRTERRRQELADRESPAMLYLVGRTPLHLGLETYDSFDGRTWEHRHGTKRRDRPEVHTHFGKPWVNLDKRIHASIFRGENCYAIKVINLKTNRIPSPPLLKQLHIDRVDRSDFFGWTADGMVEMSDREYIPQLTVIHLHAHGVNLHSLRTAYDFRESYLPERRKALVSYRQPWPGYRQTAEDWVSGVPAGWLQVEAVIGRLRSDFLHEPDSAAPEDCEDVVAHFLRAGEGPDYLFATTATVLLRSLGYPTRLVTGFYADPERFDYRGNQTAIRSDDVHVWAEVCVDGHNWVTLEPTPGYQPHSETLTWSQWAALLVRRGVEWCRRHLVGLTLAALVLAALAVSRCIWLDLLGLVICRLLGLRSSEARVLWTIRLLEWRAWLAGRPRPQQKTIATWYSPLVESAADDLQPAVQSFLRLSDRLLYAPYPFPVSHCRETRTACDAVVTVSKRKSIQLTIAAPSSDAT